VLSSARTVRSALIGFLAVAALVLSGLTWATVTSLRLEERTHEAQVLQRAAQTQTDLRKSLEIARLRMDSVLWPVLIREAARPYWEYAAYYYTKSEDGGVHDAELTESPLRGDDLEPWITLYFQVTEDVCWTSPQLVPARCRPEDRLGAGGNPAVDVRPTPPGRPPCLCMEIDDADPTAVERKRLLDRLAVTCTPEFFAEHLAAVVSPAADAAGGALAEGTHPEAAEDLLRRQSRVARLQQQFLPPRLECESSQQVHRVTGREIIAPAEEAEQEYFPVRVHPIGAMDIVIPGDPVPKLALVRGVDIGSERVFQGFVVDLALLTEALAPRVRDLFDPVQLEPALSAADAGPTATQLGSLPVRLVVSEPSPSPRPAGMSLVRMTVVFAWVTALAALTAVGLGVKRLVNLTERRKEFTYAVTHELRTPLTTFQLYTDMLAAGLVPEAKRAVYLETLNRESRRLSELLTEVLEFARVENNAVRVHLGPQRIGTLMDAARERYAARCGAAGLALDVDANGMSDRSVYTDPDLALQVLGTLIDNACKYAAASADSAEAACSAAPTVQLRAIGAGNRVAIEVVDNGPGIAAQDRRELFKPFRRGSPEAVTRTGGVGLGLALAKRWTRLLHGALELVERPEQRGACFRLTLPGGLNP
jgi:signal transduction histidine kinase